MNLDFLLCFLYELLPFIVLIIILVAGVAICVLWDCFAILLVEKIDFAFTYSISYIRAIRDDPIVQKNYIAKLDKELELYNFEEKRILLKCFFHKPYTTYYDWENKKRLLWKKRGYEKGIQSAMKKF